MHFVSCIFAMYMCLLQVHAGQHTMRIMCQYRAELQYSAAIHANLILSCALLANFMWSCVKREAQYEQAVSSLGSMQARDWRNHDTTPFSTCEHRLTKS